MSFSSPAVTIKNNKELRQRTESFKKDFQTSTPREVTSKEQNILRINKAESVRMRKLVLEIGFYLVLLFSIYGATIVMLS